MSGPVWLVHLESPPGSGPAFCTGEPYEYPKAPTGSTLTLCTGCGIVAQRLAEARAALTLAEQTIALLIRAAGGEIRVPWNLQVHIEARPTIRSQASAVDGSVIWTSPPQKVLDFGG